MQQYSIGAVSKLTQIPAHTLRKWESRHGIATPVRTPTGRRVYTQEHVEILKLIKRLVADGHSLAHLANLDFAALQDLAGQHEHLPARSTVASIALIGPNVARLLTGERLVSQRFDGTLQQWLEQKLTISGLDALVVEAATLPIDLVEALLQLNADVERLIVVYSFASRQTLNGLHAQGIDTLHGPVDDDSLLLFLEPAVPSALRPPAKHRFSPEELARIAALNPGLQCECPNHIAQLLMGITAFERYSQECVDLDPSEQVLHTQLADISSRARALFEEALIAVATADGIALALRD